MSDIFTALSTEKPDGSFYQMSTSEMMMQHMDSQCNLIAEADVSGTSAEVIERTRKGKTATAATFYTAAGVSATWGRVCRRNSSGGSHGWIFSIWLGVRQNFYGSQ